MLIQEIIQSASVFYLYLSFMGYRKHELSLVAEGDVTIRQYSRCLRRLIVLV